MTEELPKIRLGKLSFAEFTEFMHKRFLKRMSESPGKPPCCVGSIFPNPLCPDAKLVECAKCGMPLYVVPWVFEEMSKYRVPWDPAKMPVFCEFCVPPALFKGTMVQDLAAVMQYKGEK